MASKSAPKTTQKSAPTRKPQVRQAITLELVQAHAPHAGLAENLSRTFGIEPVDYAAIREGTEENVVRGANVLRDDLNDKAMEIHLQRIVGAFVGSAYGAATFYQSKVTQPATSPWRPRTTTATRTARASPASRARPSAPASSPPRWACKPTP